MHEKQRSPWRDLKVNDIIGYFLRSDQRITKARVTRFGKLFIEVERIDEFGRTERFKLSGKKKFRLSDGCEWGAEYYYGAIIARDWKTGIFTEEQIDAYNAKVDATTEHKALVNRLRHIKWERFGVDALKAVYDILEKTPAKGGE